MRLSPTLAAPLLSVSFSALSLATPGALLAQQTDEAILAGSPIFSPTEGYGGMVASQEALATRAGVDVLREGGNAVDAAVTTAFALAVTLPRAGNLGGGGFMLVHWAESGQTIAINFRETAPAAAHRDLFLDANGEPDEQKSRFSALASGVPGSVRGLCDTLERYGTISLERALRPAIELAEGGFAVTPDLADSLASVRKAMSAHPASNAAFYKPDGTLYKPDEILRQPDLAQTLRLISQNGPDGFYKGEVADKLVAYLKEKGGLITHEDLAAYRPVFTEPVMTSYRGYQIAAMPPPSSGVFVLQILKLLEPFDLHASGPNSAQTIHLFAEASKRAFADRTQYLGDPAFTKVPVEGLLSGDYLKERQAEINPDKPTPADAISHGTPAADRESPQTTHFSVMDAQGNAVVVTTTINFSYGSRHMAPGTGFLLNNEMDDFVSKPGEPNAFGLLGGDANAIEPGKRMASSMSPTLVFKEGKPWLATGSPGGSRIITTVAQMLINVIDHDMNVAEAAAAPRVHHQWQPDYLRIERGLSPDTVRLLEERGYVVKVEATMGSTQSILTENGRLFSGASDPRRPGAETEAVSLSPVNLTPPKKSAPVAKPVAR